MPLSFRKLILATSKNMCHDEEEEAHAKEPDTFIPSPRILDLERCLPRINLKNTVHRIGSKQNARNIRIMHVNQWFIVICNI